MNHLTQVSAESHDSLNEFLWCVLAQNSFVIGFNCIHHHHPHYHLLYHVPPQTPFRFSLFPFLFFLLMKARAAASCSPRASLAVIDYPISN